MAPLTWDRPTPPPPTTPFDEGAWTDEHESVDFGEGAETLITTATYDLRPKFTGRSAPMQQLQQLVDRAFAVRGRGKHPGEPGTPTVTGIKCSFDCHRASWHSLSCYLGLSAT